MGAFENRYVLDQTRFLDWVRHPLYFNKHAASRLMWVLIAIALVGCSVLYLVRFDWTFAVFLAGALGCLYIGLVRNIAKAKTVYRKMTILYRRDKWERVIGFGTNGIFVQDVGDGTKTALTDIVSLTEKRNYYVLLTYVKTRGGREKRGIFLDKNGFVGIDCAGFVEFCRKHMPNAKIKVKPVS